MYKKTYKFISLVLIFILIFQQSGSVAVAGEFDISTRLNYFQSSIFSDTFYPSHLRYLSYDNLSNSFRVLLDNGDQLKNRSEQDFSFESKSTTKELLNYFFIGLSLPNDSFWVNLRPDSPDNVIDPLLAQTDIGRVMLEADVQLKKDTARLTSPETLEGKEYWTKLYQKAGEIYGSQNITIPTLTRPWIVPNEIIIREATDNAYIYKATLKVMLEEDYLKGSSTYNFTDERAKALNSYSSELIRQLILPRLTKEINSSKRYAPLRQVYYSLILAQWFKQRHQGQSFTNQYLNLIDSKDLTNLVSKTDWSTQTYFNQYQKSFKDGEYNIKAPIYTPYGQVIRSYFSGGIVPVINLPLPGQAIVDPSTGAIMTSIIGKPSNQIELETRTAVVELLDIMGKPSDERGIQVIKPIQGPTELVISHNNLALPYLSKIIVPVMSILLAFSSLGQAQPNITPDLGQNNLTVLMSDTEKQQYDYYRKVVQEDPVFGFKNVDKIAIYPWGRALIERSAQVYPGLALEFSGYYINQPWAQALIEKAMLAEPELALIFWRHYINQPWAQAQFEKAALADPWIALMCSGLMKEISTKSNDPAIKVIIAIQGSCYPEKTKYRMASLLHEIVVNNLSLEEASRIVNNDKEYLLKLIKIKNQLNYLGSFSVERGLSDLSLRVISVINSLHDKPDDVRFALAEGLSTQELYTLMVYAEQEVFTSSFNGLFNRFIERMQQENISGKQLLDSVGQNKFRIFIKLCAGFNRLNDFLGTMDQEAQNALLSAFAGNIDKEKDRLSQAVVIADAFSMISDPIILKILQAVIKVEYERVKQGLDKESTVIYRLLAEMFGDQIVTSEGWLKNISQKYNLSNLIDLPVASFFNAQGVNIQQHFFYDDEDGVNSFAEFLSTYQNEPGWKIENKGSYVIISSAKADKKIEIYANKPKRQDQGQNDIANLFKEKKLQPYVIVHRGHSYHIERTLDAISPAAHLVFLGSCGGYNNTSIVLDKSPQAQIISTKGIGVTSVNGPLLRMLNEEMLNGKDVSWREFWEKAERILGTNENFRTYISPDRNLGVLFIKAYQKLIQEKEIDTSTNPQPHSLEPGRNSIPVNTGYNSASAKGGVDFRSLPIITQTTTLLAGSNLRSPLMGKAGLTDIDDIELQEIKKLINAGIIPSIDRVKDYIFECFKKDNSIRGIGKILSCLISILRLEEEYCIPTEPQMKQILVLLESDKPFAQMKLALMKINVVSTH